MAIVLMAVFHRLCLLLHVRYRIVGQGAAHRAGSNNKERYSVRMRADN